MSNKKEGYIALGAAFFVWASALIDAEMGSIVAFGIFAGIGIYKLFIAKK